MYTGMLYFGLIIHQKRIF